MNKKSLLNILNFELKVQLRTRSFWLISLIPPLAMILVFIVNHSNRPFSRMIVENKTELQKPIADSPLLKVNYGSCYDWENRGYDARIIFTRKSDQKIQCDVLTKGVLLPENQKAILDGISMRLAETRLNINLSKIRTEEQSKIVLIYHSENTNISILGVSLVATFLLYLIILQFSSSIMRMTGREKKNRICEILLSAMSSRDIMAGKLIAGLLAALIQIMLWCIIGVVVISVLDKIPSLMIKKEVFETFMGSLSSLPQDQLITFLIMFILYLVGGFLLYSILFSILGAISNENTNTQQFSLVITMPLLLTFMYVVKNIGSYSSIVEILSYIPLSSPIASFVLFANGGTTLSIVISLVLLYATIVLAFNYSCILYEKGSLAVNNKVTLNMMINWIRVYMINKKRSRNLG